MVQHLSKYSIKVQLTAAFFVLVGVVSYTYKFTSAYNQLSEKANKIIAVADKVSSLEYRVLILESELKAFKEYNK